MVIPAIKWIKPDKEEPFYISFEGRFEIAPLYMGRTTPQAYEVFDNMKKMERWVTYGGVKSAKEYVTHHLSKEIFEL